MNDGGSLFHTKLARKIVLTALHQEAIDLKLAKSRLDLRIRESSEIWHDRMQWIRIFTAFVSSCTTLIERILFVLLAPIFVPVSLGLVLAFVSDLANIGKAYETMPSAQYMSYVASRMTRIGCDYLEVAPQWLKHWEGSFVWYILWTWRWFAHTAIDTCDCSLTGSFVSS